jgi:hypothetical protein
MMIKRLREQLSRIFAPGKAGDNSFVSAPEIKADSRKVVRAATVDDLKSLAQALKFHGVDYLLIGGYALHALGYQRNTTDIDLVLKPDKEQGERLKRAMLSVMGEGIEALDPAWFEEGETIRLCEKFTVDLMFNACGESFATLLPYRQSIDLDGVQIYSVSMEGLLKTKQSSRAKDAMDRLILERALMALKSEAKAR